MSTGLFQCILLKPNGRISLVDCTRPTSPLNAHNDICHSGLGALSHTGRVFGIFCEYSRDGAVNVTATRLQTFWGQSVRITRAD